MGGVDGNNWYILVYCDLASFLNLIHFQDSISCEGGCSDITTLTNRNSIRSYGKPRRVEVGSLQTGGRLECVEIHYHLQIQNVPEKFPIDILDRSIFFSNRSAEEATSLHALGPLWTVW